MTRPLHRRVVALLSLCSAVALVLLAAPYLLSSESERIQSAKLVRVHGRVLLRAPGSSSWREANLKERLAPGTAIRTDSNATAVVSLSDRNSFAMGDQTEVAIERSVLAPSMDTASGAFFAKKRQVYQFRIVQEKGKVLSQLKGLKGGSYEVKTPLGTAAAKGTTFLSRVIPSSIVGKPNLAKVEFIVLEGRIGVTAGQLGGSVDVSTGQNLELGGPTAGTVETMNSGDIKEMNQNFSDLVGLLGNVKLGEQGSGIGTGGVGGGGGGGEHPWGP